LVYVADKKGFFRDEGLEVHYRKFLTGKDALADVIAGQSDIATVFESPIIRRIYEGYSIRILTTLHRSTKNTGLVALKTHGISVASDLAGKTVAVPKGTNAEYFLNLLLTIEGVDKSTVTIIDLPAPECVKALSDGRVDAVSLYNPFLYNAYTTISAQEIVTIYSDIYTELSMLAGTSEVQKHPAKYQKLLSALVRAENFIDQNKSEAIAITDAWLPQYDAKTISDVWDLSTTSNRLDYKMLTVLDQQARFYNDHGYYNTPVPTMRDHIFLPYLRTVDPERVTLE
jgi:ABC-type nitrate/sulfonate/bicarbonate transport system substrate-binding protein